MSEEKSDLLKEGDPVEIRNRIEILEKAVKEDPKNAVIYYQLGELQSRLLNNCGWLYLDSSLFQELRTKNNELDEFDPIRLESSPSASDKAHSLWNLRKAIRLKPDYAEAYAKLGEIYTDIEKYDSAIKNLEMAVKLEPNNIDYLEALGYAHAHYKNYAKAIAIFKKCLTLDPDGDWKIEIDSCQEGLKNDRKALALLETGIQISSGHHVDTLYRLLVDYKQAGLDAKAAEIFNKLSAISQANPELESSFGSRLTDLINLYIKLYTKTL